MLLQSATIDGHRPRRPRWSSAILAAVITTLAIASWSYAAAPTASPPLVHWHHTAWVGDSAPPAPGAHRLARTPDGYLWLGAIGGVLRFDGVRFTYIDESRAPALASRGYGEFHPRLLDREGVLWIARPDGALVTYRDGQFQVAIEPGLGAGTEMAEDGRGRLWLFGGPAGMVHRAVHGGPLEPFTVPGLPSNVHVIAVVPDRAQGVWIGTRAHGLWHVTDQIARRHPAEMAEDRPHEVRPLLQSRNGTLWAIGPGLGTGLHRLVADRWIRVVPPGIGEGLVRGRAVVEDADGTVWIASGGAGVLRWRDGVLEQFSTSEGLSDGNAHDVLVDAEGNVWVTTDAGLDRLRRAAFATLTASHGLPFEAPQRLVEDSNGQLWATGSPDRKLYRLSPSSIGGGAGRVAATLQPLPAGDSYDLLGAASGGGLWLGPHRGGLLRLTNGRLTTVGQRSSFPAERVTRAIEAPDGTVWVTFDGPGFGRVRDGRYSSIDLPGSPSSAALAIALDGTGAVWVSAADAPFVYQLRGDRVIASVDAAAGLPGVVRHLALESDDSLWGATERELVRLTPAGAAAVRVPSLAMLLAAQPHLAIADGFLWIGSEAGIARLPLPDLQAIAAGKANARQPTVFRALDGLPVARVTSRNNQPITRTRDGRLWFSTPAGLSIVDPADVPQNQIPPRVVIEEVSLAGEPVPLAAAIDIPPNPQRLTVRVTATSLRMPERVRIQYMLEGVDGDWMDIGADRSVGYAQLRPGAYAFRARAWNEDGVPSDREAVLSLQVQHAWYQTIWFMALALVIVTTGAASAAWSIQRKSGRRSAARAQERFDTILSERTRIARELHDSLLQGFTGVTLHLQALQQRLKQAPHDASASLEAILGIADRSLREAREMVWDMRAHATNGEGLGDALQEVGRAVILGAPVALHCTVVGTPRPLTPSIEMVILRVAREAVANALTHGSPSAVHVELSYEPRHVRLSVRDNGCGFLPEALESAVAEGHWGVAGMRERARNAGGSLEITSTPGLETRVELVLPAI